MAERLPPELSPTARALLGALRDDESPRVVDRQRGLAAVRSRVHTEAPVSAANGRFYAKAVIATLMLAAALLLVIKGVGVGVTALANQAREPGMEAPYQGGATAEGGHAVAREPQPAPRRRTSRARAERPAPLEVVPQPKPELGEVPVQHVAPAATPRSVVSKPAVPVHDLTAEIALIKKATAAKHSGNASAGLAALREHGRRFARGTLAHERMVLQAELLCAAGRQTEARALAGRFLRSHGGSALAGRMREACPAG